MSGAVLSATGMAMAYGGLRIFDGLDLELNPGERHAVIGPNGAGKSTFVGLLSGTLTPVAGRIELGGVDVTAMSASQRARRGLARTFQINSLFPHLTPLETLVLAVAQRTGSAGVFWKAASRWGEVIAEAGEALDLFGLYDVRDAPTRQLAYGQQRMLEVAIAYALKPRVMLLDEPAAGLTTAQGIALFDLLDRLAGDMTCLFVEHDMAIVFRYADRISVLADGRILAQGTPDEIRDSRAVRDAYLGH